MKFSKIYDPRGTCRDITGLGRWGNGDVEVFFEHTSEIDDVVELISSPTTSRRSSKPFKVSYTI